MLMKRKLWENHHALSVMYDAVFFIVLVSLAGAILLPAMMNQTAIQSSVEKHREELVDETLLMLMTSREPEFGYTFAGSQIESLIGNYSDNWLMNTTIQALLGKQLQHKTYADLCTETLISQLSVFHTPINVFTNQYTTHLEECITRVIQNHTGNKYNFNLSLIWHPIKGVPLGGELFIGDPAPEKNLYVASSSITLPETSLSQWLTKAEDFVVAYVENDSTLQNISDYLTDFSELNQTIVRDNLTIVIQELFDAVLFENVNLTIDGKTHTFTGVINTTVDFIFDKIQGSIQSILDKALGGVSDLLGNITSDLPDGMVNITGELDRLLINTAAPLIQVYLPSFNPDDVHSLTDVFTELKRAIIQQVRSMINVFLDPYIDLFVAMIMKILDPVITTVSTVSSDILDFFSQRINVLRAEIRLSIWEARG